MRSASLLFVFILAKLAVVLGHTGPLTVWSPLAYFWQDVLVASAFAAVDVALRRIGTPERILWAMYWALVIYAVINIPVGRAVFTPLTWPMLRAARGPLADSMSVYLTATNVVLGGLVLLAAVIAPGLTRLLPSVLKRLAVALAIAVALLGPIASRRTDARGMDRNVVTALIPSELPRVSASAKVAEWRDPPFEAFAAEDLRRFRGAARGWNVVMVGLESTAAQYLSLYGSGQEVMPNLSALSGKSLVFENAYAVYPESIKGLYSVLCSTFPAFDSRPEEYANSGCRSVASALGDAGYRTALFHSGRFAYLGMESIIRNRGYQTLEDAGDIGGNYKSSFGVDEPATVARMLAWIDKLPREQSFFLTYLPIAGHHPYATPGGGPFKGSADIDQYRNALHYGDTSLGALVEGLRARGLDQKTIWVIYGDHGEAFYQHEGNYGHTFFLYEENVHVPFLIAAPRLMTEQLRVRKTVSLVDIAPTVLDLVGIKQENYQGRTMLDPQPRMALFFTDYSLGLLGLRDGRWKFVYETGSGKTQLFDLENDLRETLNLSDREALRVSRYTQLWGRMASCGGLVIRLVGCVGH
jgi:glucan phosphoethanolaminetransferase (alkaline phosphatase superfamily)